MLAPVINIDIKNRVYHHGSVRTTLSFDDEIVPLIQRYARSRSLSLGKAVSELVRRGLTARRLTRVVHGLQVFDLPPDSPEVTTEQVRRIAAGGG